MPMSGPSSSSSSSSELDAEQSALLQQQYYHYMQQVQAFQQGAAAAAGQAVSGAAAQDGEGGSGENQTHEKQVAAVQGQPGADAMQQMMAAYSMYPGMQEMMQQYMLTSQMAAVAQMEAGGSAGDDGSLDVEQMAQQMMAAAAAVDASKSPASSSSSPANSEAKPVHYVNPKQYDRIMKRRAQRERLEAKYPGFSMKRKAYLHESRHRHACNRKRGPGGRFLSKEEKAAYAAKLAAEEAEKAKSKGVDGAEKTSGDTTSAQVTSANPSVSKGSGLDGNEKIASVVATKAQKSAVDLVPTVHGVTVSGSVAEQLQNTKSSTSPSQPISTVDSLSENSRHSDESSRDKTTSKNVSSPSAFLRSSPRKEPRQGDDSTKPVRKRRLTPRERSRSAKLAAQVAKQNLNDGQEAATSSSPMKRRKS